MPCILNSREGRGFMSKGEGALCGFISCGNQSACHTFLYKHDRGGCVNQLRQILNSRTFQLMLPVALRTQFYFFLRRFSHLHKTLFLHCGLLSVKVHMFCGALIRGTERQTLRPCLWSLLAVSAWEKKKTTLTSVSLDSSCWSNIEGLL